MKATFSWLGVLCRWWWGNGLRGHLLDLPDQKALLVDELLVFRAVFEECGEKAEKLFAVADENLLHCQGLVGVRYEYLLLLVPALLFVAACSTLKT